MYVGKVISTATPYLIVRNAPGGTEVGRLKPGTDVEVEYVENGWAKLTSPVVSNKPDRQWVKAEYLDLSEQTDPGPVEPPPAGEPGTSRTDALHIDFAYDDQGNLVRLHVLEQFSNGSSLAREFYPQEGGIPQ